MVQGRRQGKVRQMWIWTEHPASELARRLPCHKGAKEEALRESVAVMGHG
jgi:hypothetical protein